MTSSRQLQQSFVMLRALATSATAPSSQLPSSRLPSSQLPPARLPLGLPPHQQQRAVHAWTQAATVAVPSSQLLQRLSLGLPLMALCLTAATTECVVLAAPYSNPPQRVCSGSFLTSEELKHLVQEHKVSGLLLGGTGLFRADGQTHYGARKLISGVMGIVYEKGGLPRAVEPQNSIPIWLCREGVDDPALMLTRYLQQHAPGFAPHAPHASR